MDKIFTNFQDPSWWFTGLFFLFLASVLPWLYKKILFLFKSNSRKRTKKKLLFIKSIRHSAYKVHHQITIEQSYFLIFCITCFIYLVLLFISPLAKIFNENMIVGFILSSPIYITEIIWLNKRSFIQTLIERAEKVA